MAKKTNIKCPHCGCEYLPAEIYYPDEFLGKPLDVFRDENGAILGINGTDMNTKEIFYCEKCGKCFSVEASVSFKTAPHKDLFDDDFTVQIKSKRKE